MSIGLWQLIFNVQVFLKWFSVLNVSVLIKSTEYYAQQFY